MVKDMKRVLPLLVVAVLLLTAIAALAEQRASGTTPMRRATVRNQQPRPSRNWWGPPPQQNPAPPQNPGTPPQTIQGPRARGLVAAVGSDSITIRTQLGFNTYTVSSTTEIIVRGAPGALADIAVGNIAMINFDFDLASLTTPAKRIAITLAEPSGRITSIEGNLVKITDEFGVVWNVTVSQDTKITCLQQPLALADLRVGDWGRAEGQIQGNNVQASALQIQPTVFKGAVMEVNANTIKLKTVDQRIVEGALSDVTRVLIRPRVGPNQPGTRSDIKKDMPANISGLTQEGQPMDVLVVELLTGR
jgi:hypothetical protein